MQNRPISVIFPHVAGAITAAVYSSVVVPGAVFLAIYLSESEETHQTSTMEITASVKVHVVLRNWGGFTGAFKKDINRSLGSNMTRVTYNYRTAGNKTLAMSSDDALTVVAK